MAGFKKFKVYPSIPEKLSALKEIIYNLWFSWNPQATLLFSRMDEELWKKVNGNPVKLLGEIDQIRLEELANDDSFVIELESIHRQLTQYKKGLGDGVSTKDFAIAYFSLEYGLNESLPIYSGGLGILSGDHIKSASDVGLNLFGVGLLYQTGYFQQYLNQDGWQQEFYKINDFHNMGVSEITGENDAPVIFELDFPGRQIAVKAWKLEVGRIYIYLLDTNISPNSEQDRNLTAQLYGGDREIRLQQEILLGIGGMKLIEILNLSPAAIHMNEGHSAFAAFERARLLMKKHDLAFQEAAEVVRKSGIFTTHTPVPAGNDVFDSGLIRKYFSQYVLELGISIEDFLKLGRIHPENLHENFSMTVAAINHSTYINGVSQLHARVSRKMWKEIWPQTPDEHIPIHAITNGIHTATWISQEMTELFQRYLGAQWQQNQDNPQLWDKISKVPDPELWKVHEYRRRRLIQFVRRILQKQLEDKGVSRLFIDEAKEALNPEALTIGFARRFATYKRGNLILKDPARLLKILMDTQRPVQIIFAGKAHPQDAEGKRIIEHIIHFINSNHLQKKVVFMENYDIGISRYMLQGVDVWLNNPLRPLEACGTSGMKATANGVLNLSVLDGWWDEAYDFNNGWAIGNGEEYKDRHYQDSVESKAIYSILENDIVPLFYQRDSYGLPREWINMMKNGFKSIASFYNTQRMVKDYNTSFYKPAIDNFMKLRQKEFAQTRQFIQWKSDIQKDFHKISVSHITYSPDLEYKINEPIQLQAILKLGNIKPEDINVSIYYGNLSAQQTLEDSNLHQLIDVQAVEGGNPGEFIYSGSILCRKTGDFGFKLRITPQHPLMANPYEMNLIKWE